eukprot:1181809-Prorocentrum_minimum.AAC.3
MTARCRDTGCGSGRLRACPPSPALGQDVLAALRSQPCRGSTHNAAACARIVRRVSDLAACIQSCGVHLILRCVSNLAACIQSCGAY